ncbi:MAG TPA: hypothetical protein DCE44_02700, partial [Verrucomicrobiales bacterium]|nr:hypothetical protein [Verrucomicrobiales bacterium]
VAQWAYPDTGQWDPERNTREFIAAMPHWKQHGLLAVTLNLQGGSPKGYSREQPWYNSAFEADGSLRPDYLARLERILNRADELGMVVILGFFYFGQDERLSDEAAVVRGVDNVVAWLSTGGWQNVLIEINNECNVRYDHPILGPDRVTELIKRARTKQPDGRRFLVGTSYGGGTIPGTNVAQASDFLLLHGNGVNEPARIREMVRQTRALTSAPKPILFNEDDHFDFDRPENNFTTAVAERASWGVFDYRMKGEGFDEGFQSVPVNWSLASSARKRGFFTLLAEITGSLPQGATASTSGGRWWKGNLHTHSFWSDGDDYPEMIAAWYRDHGYQFLALSDHNTTLEGQVWIPTDGQRAGGKSLAKYLQRFGRDWVEQRQRKGTNEVSLKPPAEFRTQLEQPGQFLLIPAEEITGHYLTAPVHVNATNLRNRISLQGGTNVLDVMQRSVNAVLAQRAATGQPMFPHINHPNFGWGITAEDLMRVEGERFFEIYNGHPSVNNEGDTNHASVERMWDIVLTWRLGVLGLPPMFGLAVDDSHSYHTNSVGLSNPGRGWVMVRAPQLTPESLIQALERGDFYASSGVTLNDIRREGATLRIEIASEPGVTYLTRFIGTRRGFDPTNEPVRNAAGEKLRVTNRYDDDVGEILAEQSGPLVAYEMGGDELYVRAVIRSSKPKSNPYRNGETEAAWTQPVIP